MKSKLDAKTISIADHIRHVREYRDYTQEYMAAKLKISQTAYCKLELGYCNITIQRLAQIALILEVEFIDLVDPDAVKAIGGNQQK